MSVPIKVSSNGHPCLGSRMGGLGGGSTVTELPRDFLNLISQANLGASDSVPGDSTFRRHLRCSAAPPVIAHHALFIPRLRCKAPESLTKGNGFHASSCLCRK